MAKKNKKRNFKDTTQETNSIEEIVENLAPKVEIEYTEEEKVGAVEEESETEKEIRKLRGDMPQFKDPNMKVTLRGGMVITNENLNPNLKLLLTRDMGYKEDDFC